MNPNIYSLKKSALLALLVAVSVAGVVLIGYSPEAQNYAEANANLIGHWAFEEGSGQSANDSTANGFHGTIAGNPAWVSGQVGGALSLNGQTDYISLPLLSSGVYGTNQRTIMFWFNASDFDTGLARTIMHMANGGTGSGLWIFAEDNGISVGFNGHRVIFDKGNLNTDTWYHFALVIPSNSTTGQVRGYINGVQKNLATEGGSPRTINSGSIAPFIGADNGNGNFFQGSIDEVKVFDRALTDNEIANEYSPTIPDTEDPTVPSNLVATPMGSTQIDLSWDASSDNVGVIGYDVYRDGSFITTIGNTSYSDQGLSPSTQYSYTVEARDAAGNLSGVSAPVSATTASGGDTTPPVISGVSDTQVTPTRQTVFWTTDEPATSQVEYGPTTSYGQSTTLNSALVTSHSVTIDGLSAGALYHYRVRSSDGSSNEAVSGDFTFTTMPPVSSGGPAGYWKLDDDAGLVATDSSGNGNDGTLTNGTAWAVGRINGALSFDGNNDYVEVANSAFLNPGGAITIAGWINPSQVSTAQNVVSKGTTQNSQYVLRLQGGSNPRMRFMTKANSLVSMFAPTKIQPNVWTHVAATYDGSFMRLYINGSLDASAAQSGQMTDSGDPLYISSNRGTGIYFDGLIDEVYVYDKALTSQEVLQLYNAANTDTVPPTVSFTSFGEGTVVSNTMELTAEASDNAAVAGVTFLIDGAPIGAEDTTAPYSLDVITSLLSPGQHTVSARARDTANLTTTSAPVTITVDNASQRTSVVLIMSDDQRYDTMNHMPLTTARFTQDGVVFSNAVVAAPICCPSRANMFTGQYAHNHGVLGNLPPYGAPALDDSATLATWLHNAGYRTGLFGKYLNDYDDMAPYIPPGWDEWHVFNSGNGGFFNYSLIENGTSVSYGSAASDYSTVVLANKVSQFISTTPDDQPFFAFLTAYGPHEPHTPHPSDVGSLNGMPPHRPPSFNEADVSDKPTWIQNLAMKTPSEVATADTRWQRYLETLPAMDRAVDQVINTLAVEGRLDDALVIYTSDHGISWGEHRWFQDKDCAYEVCYRVPLMIMGPGISPRTDDNLVSNVDVSAGIRDVTDVVPTIPTNGISLLPLLQNASTPWPNEVLIEALARPPHRKFWSIRVPQYIYTEYENGDREFYDYAADPHELDNAINNPAYASVVQTLQNKLNTMKSE